VKGRLTVVSPFTEVIADHDAVAAALARNSGNADVTAELVYVPDGGSAKSYEGSDVAGKIVISEGGISALFRTAVNRFGAAGVVAYGTRYPERYPDMIVWNSVPAAAGGRTGFGFNIVHPKGLDLIARLKRGEKITVHAEVESKRYPAKMEVVTGLIPGTGGTDQELLLIAHLFEGISKQGANDNISGSVCILETGRTILELIRRGVIAQPRRSVRFLWVPEISGTRAYIMRYPEEIGKMIAGINMDMVGEDLVKTRSYFHVSRTFHSVPSFFNDIVQEFAELTAAMNNDAHGETYGRFNLKITAPGGSQMPFLLNILGYDSGSDHGVLSNGVVKVPTVYLECWPDDFYHSSMDTPDKTDPTQLKRVAFIAAASTITAAQAAPDDAPALLALVAGNSRRRTAESCAAALQLLNAATAENVLQNYKKARIIAGQAFIHEMDNVQTLTLIAEDEQAVLQSIDIEKENLRRESGAFQESLRNLCTFLCRKFGVRFAEPELSPKEREMSALIPVRSAQDMIEQMRTPLRPQLPRSSGVYRFQYAANELANMIDGRRSMLDIAYAVMAECGGPEPEDAAAYFYALEKEGSIRFKKK